MKNIIIDADTGANESLEGVFESAPAYIHGDNGIGNVILPESSQKPIAEAAEDFIIRKANELDGELIVITTGRMTNLAKAYLKDKTLPKKLKKVVSMGGCIDVPGNINNYAEANIHGDAKAADIVMGAGFCMTLVGLDVTMKTFITDRDVKNLCEYASEECRPIAEYIRDVLKFYFEFHRVSMGMANACVVHDPLAMLIAEDPSLGLYKMIRASVEYEHEPFKGMIKKDMGFVPNLDREKIAACIAVDSTVAVRRLFSVFQDMTPGRYNWN